MPGVFGILTANAEAPPDCELAGRMRAILRHAPSYKDYVFESPGCLLGGSTPAYYNAITEPAFSRDGNLCLVMEGEIFNQDELREGLSRHRYDGEANGPAELMLRLYEAYSTGLAHRVNGLFLVAIWNKHERSLTLINDRLGLHPLYYHDNGTRLIFAPESKALLCDPKIERKLDTDALADFFTFGSIFGDRTFVSGVRVMPPGTVMHYRAGKLTQRRYWDFPFVEEPSGEKSAREYVDELDHVLRDVFRRQTKDPCRYGMSLSGGRDSRIVAGYLGAAVSPLSTFTFGDPNSDEVRFARRCCEIIGGRYHHVEGLTDDLPNTFQKVVWLTEGPIDTPEYYRLGQAMAAEVDVAFNGHAGDVLGGRWVTRSIAHASGVSAVVDETYERYSRRLGGHAGHLFSDEYLRLVRGAAKKNFNQSFADLWSEKPAHAQFKQEMRTKNSREYARVNDVPRLFLRHRYPFFDYKVLDFFLKLPTCMRLHEHVYLGVLVEKQPGLADVPYPNRRYSLRAEHLYLGPYYRLRNKVGHALVDRFYSRLRGIAPASTVGAIDGFFLEPEGRQMLQALLDSNRQTGYFNEAYLEKLFAEHTSRQADNSFLLHKLLTFDLYHRFFMDPGALQAPTANLL